MTFNDILQHPSSVMYIFADEKTFISKLDKKTAAIVRRKKANQYQLIAAKTGGYDGIEQAANRVREAFVNMYGMTPAQALVVLAKGGEVAGKNWSKGIYGVGAIKRGSFNQNDQITVNEKTGEILVNGVVAKAKTIYGGVSGSKITSYIYTDGAGNTFSSQKIGTKYYAGTFTRSDGTMQNANGDAITEADTNSIWTNCGSLFETLLNWILSLFGVTETKKEDMITAENTLASQSDGFVETGVDLATPLLIGGAAVGGYLLIKKAKSGKKSSKQSKK